MPSRSVQPLIALDAIVLDTETTGLDPVVARIVQIGAVVLRHGRLVADEHFDRLIDPGVPIPATATAIHGIDNAAIAGAARFAESLADFERFRADRLVIGHNIGFDLAMIARECRLAGLAHTPPASLDTRLLGQICFPSLAGYTLEILANRLGVELDSSGRHDARGDAESAGVIFIALLPVLKEKGIRTVGEANQACRRLTDVLDGFARAGWVEPQAVVPELSDHAALARIDSYPFRHHVRDVMGHPPVVVAPTLALAEAARLMMERRISSVFVADEAAPLAEAAGIVTERDVLRAVTSGGAQALQRPVADFSSRPLAHVGADDFVYRAIGRMDRLKVRHLAVTDAEGRVVGALSARDLLKVRASDALVLGDAIAAADGAPALAAAFARMPDVAGRLLQEEVSATAIAAVVSQEIGALTARAAREAEALMLAEGAGPPPVAYAVLVLGSVGRGESLLAADQDNAVVTEVAADPAAADRWFARFGTHLSDLLDAAGVAYCKGGVMARNPGFRGSIDDWRMRIDGWMAKTRPEDLLAVDIFFDFRAVHGDRTLATRLFDEAYEAAHHAPILTKLLAEQIGANRPPLTLFGGIRLSNGRVDLKIGGLFPVVAAARCLAMRHDIRERSTRERLAALRARQIGSAEDIDTWIEAHGVLVDAILRQQIADLGAGLPPGSRVDPSILGRAGQARLKAAIGKLAHVGETVKDLLFQA